MMVRCWPPVGTDRHTPTRAAFMAPNSTRLVWPCTLRPLPAVHPDRTAPALDAGKTSMLLLLAGLEQPAAGHVAVNGVRRRDAGSARSASFDSSHHFRITRVHVAALHRLLPFSRHVLFRSYGARAFDRNRERRTGAALAIRGSARWAMDDAPVGDLLAQAQAETSADLVASIAPAPAAPRRPSSAGLGPRSVAALAKPYLDAPRRPPRAGRTAA